MTRYPTCSSTMPHRAERMEASATPSNAGAFSLRATNGGCETFSLTIFTDDASLCVELAAAINGALAKHGRLIGCDKQDAA